MATLQGREIQIDGVTGNPIGGVTTGATQNSYAVGSSGIGASGVGSSSGFPLGGAGQQATTTIYNTTGYNPSYATGTTYTTGPAYGTTTTYGTFKIYLSLTSLWSDHLWHNRLYNRHNRLYNHHDYSSGPPTTNSKHSRQHWQGSH